MQVAGKCRGRGRGTHSAESTQLSSLSSPEHAHGPDFVLLNLGIPLLSGAAHEDHLLRGLLVGLQ